MRFQFRGTDAGFEADEYALLCGVAGHDVEGNEHRLCFGRLSESQAQRDPLDDWGVHTEFDDQNNGEYDKVSVCRLSRKLISVDLSAQLGGLAGVEGFDIDLDIDDEMYQTLRDGLVRIFRDMPNHLVLETI